MQARARGESPSPRWLGRRLVGFVRDWAPFVVLIAVYENLLPLVGRLRHVLYDEQALAVDLAVFGTSHPGRWLASLASPGRTAWFAFFYLSLFALPVVSGGLAYLAGRRQVFRELLFTFTLTGFVGYVGYLLVPIIGPRYYFRAEYSVALHGALAEVAGRVSEMDALRSGQPRNCFPSLHTAWGLIVLIHAHRHFTSLFFAYLLPVGSLVVATLYLRFHYAIDLIAGAILAIVMSRLTPRLLARFANDREPELPRLELPRSWVERLHRLRASVVLHWPYVALTVLTLPIYFSSLPTGISERNRGEDGAELVAAAVTGGTAHPPGYALYMLVIRLVCALFAWRDPIDVAHAASAVFALLAGIAWVKIVRSTLDLRVDVQPLPRDISAFVTGALLCFSPTLFGQAVIAEVYAFHAALVGGFLVVATAFLRGRQEVQGRQSFALGVLGAFAIGHHLTAVPIVLATWIAFAFALPRKLGKRPLLPHAFGFAVGLLPLAYLPARALADAPLSWGRPDTVARFVWVVSAQQYRSRFAFTPEDWWPRLLGQFPLGSLPVLALGLATVGGILALARRDSRRVVFLLVLVGSANFASSLPYAIRDLSSYFLPLVGVVSALVGFGCYETLRALSNVHPRVARVTEWALPVALVAIALVGSLREVDAHGQSELDRRVKNLVAHAPANALIVARGDGMVFGLWYERFVRNPRSDIDVVSRELLGQSWYPRSSGHFSSRMRWPARLEGDVDRRLRDVIFANYDQRTVVVVTTADLPNGCRRRRSGEIWCESEVTRSEIEQEGAETAHER